MSGSSNLKNLLAEMAGPMESPREHPAIESLSAYHEDKLSEKDAQSLLDHVQACPECAALLLDLPRLDEGAGLEEEEPMSPAEIDRGWLALEARLPKTPAEQTQPESNLKPFPVSPSKPAHRLTSPWYHALAAGLLLAVIGQTVRIQGLQREISQLTAPQVNTPVVVLSDARTRGSSEPKGQAVLQDSTDNVVLYLSPNALTGPQTKTYQTFRAEISGQNKQWSGGGLVMDKNGAFTISLWKQWFAPGEYLVRLYGTADGHEDKLAEFSVQLDYS